MKFIKKTLFVALLGLSLINLNLFSMHIGPDSIPIDVGAGLGGDTGSRSVATVAPATTTATTTTSVVPQIITLTDTQFDALINRPVVIDREQLQEILKTVKDLKPKKPSFWKNFCSKTKSFIFSRYSLRSVALFYLFMAGWGTHDYFVSTYHDPQFLVYVWLNLKTACYILLPTEIYTTLEEFVKKGMSMSFFKTLSKFLGLGIISKIAFSQRFLGIEKVLAKVV
ncbi:hypothetical protein K9M16_04470 [Candidatus Babeliales bacterium]|nr:hypothetical protein [Candidatus Babeliales bacterium]